VDNYVNGGSMVNMSVGPIKAFDTRNLAIADKPRDAFRGQSRSPNMDHSIKMLGMVSY